MGRRRNNFVPPVEETLSQEKPEVQEKLLNEIINPEDTQENEDKPVSNEAEELNNLSNKETEIPEIKPGDHIKLHNDVKFDLLGRRIHAGIRNYNYRVLSIRVDGMLVIECLTHCFTVKPTDVDKV